MPNMDIGKRIKELRERFDISQSELARYCGVQPSSVNGWETGATKNLRIENLVSVARAFGMTIDELLGVEHNPRDPIATVPEPIDRIKKRIGELPQHVQESIADLVESLAWQPPIMVSRPPTLKSARYLKGKRTRKL